MVLFVAPIGSLYGRVLRPGPNSNATAHPAPGASLYLAFGNTWGGQPEVRGGV